MHQQQEQPDRRMRKKGRNRVANDPSKIQQQRADQQGPKSKSVGANAPDRGQSAGEVSSTSRPSMPLPAVIRAEAAEAEQSALAGQIANGKLAASQVHHQPAEKPIQQAANQNRTANDARKLMLEDGLSERSSVDLGDVDMDM